MLFLEKKAVMEKAELPHDKYLEYISFIANKLEKGDQITIWKDEYQVHIEGMGTSNFSIESIKYKYDDPYDHIEERERDIMLAEDEINIASANCEREKTK